MLELETNFSPNGVSLNNDDLKRCAVLARDAWDFHKYMVDEKDSVKIMQLNVQMALLNSNWYAVYRKEGEIVGFIFGKIKKDFNFQYYVSSLFKLGKIFINLLRKKYGKIKNKTKILPKVLKTERNANKSLRGSNAIIMLFVVDSKMRGKGLGRKLVQAFKEHAKSRNVNRISLYSDIASNWKFYEKTGFTRITTFYDPFLSHFNNQEIESFVYEIEF